jgi:glycosyltransferase involved in cell wall biosynthesis
MTETSTEQFLKEFCAKHGRAPRILHIGNIANNAYLNAKVLNAAGFDCDVICYDYYHIMGCPEWEEVDFDASNLDHFKPDWTLVDLNHFERPKWFAQGPQNLCIEYLIAKQNSISRAEKLWLNLGRSNGTIKALSWISNPWVRFTQFFQDTFVRLQHRDALLKVWYKLGAMAEKKGTMGHICMAWVGAPLVVMCAVALRQFGRWSGRRYGWAFASDIEKKFNFSKAVEERVRDFQTEYPQRPDKLSALDFEQYADCIHNWLRLFNQYDIVQAYSTDVIYPMLAGVSAYVGFEHGTLRDFTLNDNSISRLTTLGYKLAAKVFITNGDCLEYAHRIHVDAYTPMVHPIDDELIDSVPGEYIRLHDKFSVKYLFFCPLRHDWAVKGTDKYIRALPKLVSILGQDFRLIMTKWGSQLEDSMQLAEVLGVAHLIEWVAPLSRIQLIRYQKSSDIVFDQLALPHFGATAPQAIAAGVPVIMSYVPDSTEWIIPEPAPILSAHTEEEIVAAVLLALSSDWLEEYKINSKKWYRKFHSSNVVLEKHASVYFDVSRKTGLM